MVKESLVKAGVCALDALANAEALRPHVLLPDEFLDQPGSSARALRRRRRLGS